MYGFIFSVFLIAWVIIVYNKFISSKQLVDEAWSDIDVQLKRKYDLIPTLITTVKTYAKHEQELFSKIVQLRTQALSAHNVDEKGKTDASLNTAMKRIFAIAENYPKLEASQNFLELQKQLSETENTISFARKYYNGAVRNFNILIASFPANMLASVFNQKKREFFQP